MSAQGPVIGEQAVDDARVTLRDCPNEPLNVELVVTQCSLRLGRADIQMLRTLLAQAEHRLLAREVQAFLKRNHELPI